MNNVRGIRSKSEPGVPQRHVFAEILEGNVGGITNL